jgi:hypothetical protein
MTEQGSREWDAEMVRKHAVMLSEHFDSVRIFATRALTDGQTAAITHGCGNWFAQRGQISQWVMQRDAEACDAVSEGSDE